MNMTSVPHAKLESGASVVVLLLVMTAAVCLAQDDERPITLSELGQELIETDGLRYVELRDGALQLSEDDFRDLVKQLNDDGQYSRGRMVASFLMARREHPELAKEFDERLRWTLDNRRKKGYSARPDHWLYDVWLPENTLHADPLGFEVLFLRPDLPDGVHGEYFKELRRPNPTSIDIILSQAYANVNNDKAMVARWLARVAKGLEHEQARLTPILVDLHMTYRRETGNYRSPTVSVLQVFGGPEHLLALELIIAFETAQLAVQGVTPWDEDTRLGREYGDSLRTLSVRKQGELTRAEVADDAGRIRELTAEIADIERRFEECDENQRAQRFWDQLMRAERLCETAARSH